MRFKVGDKTTLLYLADKLPHLHPFRRNINTKWARRNIARNLLLVALPHKRTRHITFVKDAFSIKGFQHAFRKFGFDDFISERWDEWMRFL